MKITRDYHNKPCDAVVGGKVCHFDSKLEYRWAQVLEFYVTAGLIAEWEYESPRCRFDVGPSFYKLDFWTVDYHGQQEWHECKGLVERRDITRFRRISRQYPDARINLVVDRIPKRRAQNIWSAKKYVYRIIEAYRIFQQISIDMEPPLSRADEQPGRRKGGL